MLNTTFTYQQPKWSKHLIIWIPFIFSLFLCGLVVGTSLFSGVGITIQTALPTFFCVLPMVFFFTAYSTQTQITELERRIADLEIKQSDTKRV